MEGVVTWRDIKSRDDQDMWHWEQERTCKIMAEVARNIWKDLSAEQSWKAEQERHRMARWPKDRPYQPSCI